MTRGNKCGILPSLALDLWRDGWAGLRRTTGNRVTAVNRTRVRIPISPPYKKVSLSRHFLLFFLPCFDTKTWLSFILGTNWEQTCKNNQCRDDFFASRHWLMKKGGWMKNWNFLMPLFLSDTFPKIQSLCFREHPACKPLYKYGWEPLTYDAPGSVHADYARYSRRLCRIRTASSAFLWMKKRGWAYYSPGMPAVVVRGITTQKSNGTQKTLKECAPWFTLIILSISENEKY